jgi:hypothetical protein
MPENLRTIFYMTRHDPLAILGFLLLGTFGVLFVHIQFKMKSVGYKTYPTFSRPSDWGLPAKYLKVRSQHGWSAWPVYLLWPSLILGVGSLVIGLFLLQN